MVPGTGREAVIKDFVRSTGVIKKEVHIDNEFISATIFLKGLANLKKMIKNKSCLHYELLWPTVRLIIWLILAMGRRVVAANFFIGLRIPKKLR